MSHRTRTRKGETPSKYLTVWTSCGPDTYLDTPTFIKYNATLKQLFVCSADLKYFSPSLVFQSKRRPYGVADGDSTNLYTVSGVNICKTNLDPNGADNIGTTNTLLGSAKILNASDMPNHLLVTTASTGHHGIHLVQKSDLATVASIDGASGSGDNQFNNPSGVYYASGYAYVCDFNNLRIVKIAVDTATPALTWTTTYATPAGAYPSDICTDGTYWYVSGWDNGFYRYSLDFSSNTRYAIGASVQGICLIPNQGDGADSTNPTLAMMSAGSKWIKRVKTSDPSVTITTFTSSGAAADSLFDPTISGAAGTWKMDDGSQLAAAASTDISWNGFSGYTFKVPGVHKAVFKPTAGNLKALTSFTAPSDNLTKIKNFWQTGGGTTQINSNPALEFNVQDLPKPIGNIACQSDTKVYGALKSMPLTTIFNAGNCALYGSLADLNPAITYALFDGNTGGITSSSIAAWTLLTSASLSNFGWSSTSVDTVLLSASDAVWTDLNKYTYSSVGNGPSLSIGGTNAAPGGTVAASSTNPMTTPGSGNTDSDWAWTADAMLMGNIKTTILTNNNLSNTIAWAQRFSAMPGVCDSIKLYGSGSGNVKVALFSDNSGAPGTVLAQTGSTAIVAGWNTIALGSSITLTAGTYYNIVVQEETSNTIPFGANGTIGTSRYWTKTYADAFTDDPSAASTYTNIFGISGYGSGHKALTGQAAVWYLTNATGYPTHKWTISKS